VREKDHRGETTTKWRVEGAVGRKKKNWEWRGVDTYLTIKTEDVKRKKIDVR